MTEKHFVDELPEQSALREDKSTKEPWMFVVAPVLGNEVLLRTAIQKIETCGTFGKKDKVIFMGNMVGENGNSREVIETLRKYRAKRPGQVIILRGEYENNLLYGHKRFSMSVVGRAFFNSYRRKPSLNTPLLDHTVEITKVAEDRRFLLSTIPTFSSQAYYFCYGGIDVSKKLEKQDPLQTIYNRSSWMKNRRKHGNKVIVNTAFATKVEDAQGAYTSLPYTNNSTTVAIMYDSSDKIADEYIAIRVQN